MRQHLASPRHGHTRDWLKRRAPDVPIPITEIIPGFTLPKHGGERKSKKAKDQADDISLKYGTEKAYILARLRRDHENLAKQVESGKLTAHAARDFLRHVTRAKV